MYMKNILKAQQNVPKNIFKKTFYSRTFANIYTSGTLYEPITWFQQL